MIMLVLRTDKPEAELYVYADRSLIAALKWQAHLKLTETLHDRLEEILNKSSILMNEIDGIVVYEGPGSFTGLRIGISTANALAYSYNLPIVATTGYDWIDKGLDKIIDGKGSNLAYPEYGQQPKTTKPRK